ncbi:MAG TPA: hypothetical protein VHH11_13920 [Gammaproteobacteria bacterium]|nr:hypothetical protein [Gammaproteobacteria bacterium]
MMRDRDTMTDDRNGTIACPWCGYTRSDTWEITASGMPEDCEACGGEIILEDEAVRTIYAFRGARAPKVDIELLRQATPDDADAYFRARGWVYHRGRDWKNFWHWNPPGTTSNGDRPAPGGMVRVTWAGLKDIIAAVECAAVHEGRPLDAVLRDMIAGVDDADDGAAS